jgi:hypothetical protein
MIISNMLTSDAWITYLLTSWIGSKKFILVLEPRSIFVILWISQYYLREILRLTTSVPYYI